jgi:hypothetical protein
LFAAALVPRSDAACAKMHILLRCDVPIFVPQSALKRSALLTSMHQSDPGGCAQLPCDSRVWEAWLTNEPARMTAEMMDLILAVIKARTLYTREVGLLRVCTLPVVRYL